jgi:hypothetical protein
VGDTALVCDGIVVGVAAGSGTAHADNVRIAASAHNTLILAHHLNIRDPT